jgi:hypothetical protein
MPPLRAFEKPICTHGPLNAKLAVSPGVAEAV